MMSHSRFFLGLILIGLCSAVTMGQLVPAKIGEKDETKKKDDRNPLDTIYLPVERDAKSKIEAVNKYLHNSKEPITPKLWEDIIAVLQGMLSDSTDKFVEVTDAEGKTSKVSVRREVNKIIGTFDEDGRRHYQRIVGPDAEEKFQKALETYDMQGMAEVSERFLHTKAGAEATLRVANWQLDRGRFVDAGVTFRRFISRNNKDVIAPEILFRAALAFKRQENEAEFAKISGEFWNRFLKVADKSEVRIGDRTFKLEQLKAEFERTTPLQTRSYLGEWLTARGSHNNNLQGNGGRPFLDARFHFPIMQPGDDDDVGNAKMKPAYDWLKLKMDAALSVMDKKNQYPIPAFFPIASGGKIIFRGHAGVYCVAAREDKSVNPPIKPGELIWRSDAEYGSIAIASVVNVRANLDQFLNLYLSNGPHGILFENTTIGAISHDGVNCYFVDDLAIPPHPFNVQNMNGRIAGAGGAGFAQFGQLTDPVYANKLVCVNLESGKLEWKLGERTRNGPAVVAPGVVVKHTTESLVSDSIFLGPPLPLRGKLYAMIERDGELYVVCLDPNKLEPSTRKPTARVPTLIWYQAIGQPNTRLPADALRRPQGIQLAYADGILVCPTNSGAVVGVDIMSRNLVWASTYKSNKGTDPTAGNGDPFGGRIMRPGIGGVSNVDTTKERWRSSAPMIVGGKVIYTAYDSDTVECVDLHDGRSIWRAPINRQDSDMFVGGVFDDKVIIVGKGYVRFHSLATGQQVRDPILTGIPTGFGVATKDVYYLPVAPMKDKGGEPGVVAIDTKTQTLKGTTRSRKKEAAGNLLFHEGDVYSLTMSGLTAFPQLDLKIRETQDRLNVNKADPIGLTDLALLQLDDGRLMPAIENFRKALSGKPPEETRAKAREKLFEAITELLQSDFGNGEKMLAEYRELCTVEIPASATEAQRRTLAEEELRRKSNYFCLVAKGRESQGRLVDAFDNYMAFGTLVGNRDMITVPDEPNTLARPDVWARGRILNMIRQATPENRVPLERKVVEAWNKVKSSPSIEDLRGFVRVFGGMFEAGNDAKILLADRLGASGQEDDLREAEYMLLAIRDGAGSDEAIAARATDSLARLYIRKGLLDDAVGMYAELGTRFGKQVVRDGKNGSQIFDELVSDKRFLPYIEPVVVTWMYPKLKANETTGAGYDIRAQQITVDIDSKDMLPFFRRNRLVLDQSNRGSLGWTLRVLDRATGEDRYTSAGMGYGAYHYQATIQGVTLKAVQVKGHVAIVTVHGTHANTGTQIAKVFAYDVADKKRLWEIDLFGKSPNPLVNNGPISQVVELDGLRVTYQDGWSTKAGQQWVVAATHTVVLTRDGLEARDNARGTVLWTKAGVSHRTHLYGDHEYVFTYEMQADGSVSALRCFRAADGVETSIPDSTAGFVNAKQAKFYGRNIFSINESGKKWARMYDPVTGKDLWKVDIAPEALPIRSIAGDMTGTLAPDGTAVLYSTATGKELTKLTIGEAKRKEHMDKVTDVIAFADGGRYFLMLNRPSENNNLNRFGFQPIFGQTIRPIRVNGHMYAFDKTSSKMLWATDDQLQDQNIILDYLEDLPIIIAAAQAPRMNPAQGFDGTLIQRTIALDKATGKAIFRKEVTSNGQSYSGLIVDPGKGTIELPHSGGTKLRFVPDDGKPSARLETESGKGTTIQPVQQRLRLGAAVIPPQAIRD